MSAVPRTTGKMRYVLCLKCHRSVRLPEPRRICNRCRDENGRLGKMARYG